MDTLALGVIAIGIVAAIGVVLVAMGDSGKQATDQPEVATSPPPKAAPRPRPRRRQQAVPARVVVAGHHNGYVGASANDPLVDGFMQVVSGELDALRLQQEKIDQRLKLIHGIAELMHDMQPSTANTNGTRRAASRG